MINWFSKLLRHVTSESAEESKKPQHQPEVGKKQLVKGPDTCHLNDNKCYRCGKPSVCGCFESVHLYKNVRVGKKYPNVEYETYLLKMPLCRECNEIEVEHGWGFHLYLQEKGYSSWNIGMAPTNDEIESVWQAFRNPKNIWEDALEEQQKEYEELKVKESHVNDKILAVIDQYEFLQKLGEGGFGSVFLARDSISQTLVAIKTLSNKIGEREHEVAELQRNFVLTSNLHHPNIASPLVLHSVSKINYCCPSIKKLLNVRKGDLFFCYGICSRRNIDGVAR